MSTARVTAARITSARITPAPATSAADRTPLWAHLVHLALLVVAAVAWQGFFG